MAYIGLDATQYERTMGSGEKTPLPAGFYTGVITRAELRDNKSTAKDPNGKYLEVEFDITSPQDHGNRKFWDKFNLVNSNAIAVKIGKEQLSDLAKSLGMDNLGDADELLGKECAFVLSVQPAQGQYSASNSCMKYLPVNATQADYDAWYASKKGATKGASAAPERKSWGTEAAAPAATATSTGAPWKKK